MPFPRERMEPSTIRGGHTIAHRNDSQVDPNQIQISEFLVCQLKSDGFVHEHGVAVSRDGGNVMSPNPQGDFILGTELPKTQNPAVSEI